jgi:capsular polysaccharide biosynthesis protein
VAAFKQASHIVAPHGAGLTHLVLCPRGARVLEIFHPLYSSPCYAMQMEAAGLDYAAMLGRDWESDAPEWNDPALADIGDSTYLERHMRVDLPLLANYLATIDRGT